MLLATPKGKDEAADSLFPDLAQAGTRAERVELGARSILIVVSGNGGGSAFALKGGHGGTARAEVRAATSVAAAISGNGGSSGMQAGGNGGLGEAIAKIYGSMAIAVGGFGGDSKVFPFFAPGPAPTGGAGGSVSCLIRGEAVGIVCGGIGGLGGAGFDTAEGGTQGGKGGKGGTAAAINEQSVAGSKLHAIGGRAGQGGTGRVRQFYEARW